MCVLQNDWLIIVLELNWSARADLLRVKTYVRHPKTLLWHRNAKFLPQVIHPQERLASRCAKKSRQWEIFVSWVVFFLFLCVEDGRTHQNSEWSRGRAQRAGHVGQVLRWTAPKVTMERALNSRIHQWKLFLQLTYGFFSKFLRKTIFYPPSLIKRHIHCKFTKCLELCFHMNFIYYRKAAQAATTALFSKQEKKEKKKTRWLCISLLCNECKLFLSM